MLKAGTLVRYHNFLTNWTILKKRGYGCTILLKNMTRFQWPFF